jgi:hypothetical protein
MGSPVEESRLLSILNRLDEQALAALFRFSDGEVYNLRVVSTMHAEDGGDVVAEVVRVASSPPTGKIPVGEFINFSLSEVIQVTLDGECVFTCVPDA